MELEEATYVVNEGGQFQVCINTTGEIATGIAVMLTSNNNTAQRKYVLHVLDDLITLIFSIADIDYVPVNETLTVLPGQQSKSCVELVIVRDDTLESNETYTVSITSDLPGVVVGNIGEATITITDDDGKFFQSNVELF